MGEITLDAVMGCLRAENPRSTEQDIRLYAAFFLDFREAEANIREHGALIIHPRTAAPIENPYGKIKAQASASLRRIRMKTETLWRQFGP